MKLRPALLFRLWQQIKKNEDPTLPPSLEKQLFATGWALGGAEFCKVVPETFIIPFSLGRLGYLVPHKIDKSHHSFICHSTRSVLQIIDHQPPDCVTRSNPLNSHCIFCEQTFNTISSNIKHQKLMHVTCLVNNKAWKSCQKWFMVSFFPSFKLQLMLSFILFLV